MTTFLEMFCEYNGALSNLWTPSEQIYESYKTWCGYKVGEVVDKAYFGRQLKKFCDGFAPKQGKTNDRRSITLYKGLIFDQRKYQAAIDTLQIMMSEVCPKQSEVVSEEEQGQQILMSEVSEANMWNEILRRLGELPKEKPLYETETSNLPQTPRTLQTSALGELADGAPTSDIPQTNSIEVILLRTGGQAEGLSSFAHSTQKPSNPVNNLANIDMVEISSPLARAQALHEIEAADVNLHETHGTPQTSVCGEPLGDLSTRDNPETSETLHETKTVDTNLFQATEDEQAKASEEHFREQATKRAGKPPLTCAVCGAGLTGHGMVEKKGKVYCAKVGCGYSARNEAGRL